MTTTVGTRIHFFTLLVEPDTMRLNSFNYNNRDSPVHMHPQSWPSSRSTETFQYPPFQRIEVKFSDQMVRNSPSDYQRHWQIQWPTEDLGPLWENAPHWPSTISTEFQGTVHCLHFPNCWIHWKLDLFYSTVVLQSPGFTSTNSHYTTISYKRGYAEPVKLAANPCQAWTGLWWHECAYFFS